jgi:caffeoyl-CoA O-methyltransferase
MKRTSKMTFQDELEIYAEKHSSTELPILSKIYRETNIRMLNPRMVSGHLQGLFLSMLSKMIAPKTILEIGTFTGYSAICLSQGLAHGGKLHTIEINDELAETAKAYFVEAGLEDSIVQHIGDAREIIPNLQFQFDLIFVDGEKREYPEYYKLCCNSLKPGGLLLADNVLWNGKVIDDESNTDTATKAIQEFNESVKNDPMFENLLLPLRDGLMMARKK